LLSLALYSSRLPGKFLLPNILRFSIISFAGGSMIGKDDDKKE
jgi:hypothetical protein